MEDGQWTRDDRGHAARRRDLAAALEHLPARPRHACGSDRCAHLGTLVRYADDFVVMCDTKAACEEAEQRVRAVLARLGLELHPEKTRTGRPLARARGLRLSRLPPAQAHERADLGADAATRLLPPAVAVAARDDAGAAAREGADVHAPRCHEDLRDDHRGPQPGAAWLGRSTFAPGNAAVKFNQVDDYVERRLQRLLVKRQGRSFAPVRPTAGPRDFFEALGLHRLRGTDSVPGGRVMPRPERPPVSRVREIRTHGLNGGLTPQHRARAV